MPIALSIVVAYGYSSKGKIIRKEPLGIELVKEIHKILTSGIYDERRYIANEVFSLFFCSISRWK